ncbi:MAG: hypothetical protein Q4F71_12655 [Paracoccus sp. (in: a-proteobacteria)]|nr:hypothetical protein [Paracoccus sp. (in: a-proteobacteria)]
MSAPAPFPALRPAAGARRIGWPMLALAVLALSACGGRMTDDVLRGGVPAATNLPRATGLPPASVRTVARRDFGWRLIYLPHAAPRDAEARAGNSLCALERKRLARIEPIALIDPASDPGARKIDIHCG